MRREAEAHARYSSRPSRTKEVEHQIQEISSRDLQLCPTGILIILGLTSGVPALVLPNLVWKPQVRRMESARTFPAYCSGLRALVVLFNLYLVAQKRALNSTRKALTRGSQAVPEEKQADTDFLTGSERGEVVWVRSFNRPLVVSQIPASHWSPQYRPSRIMFRSFSNGGHPFR